MEVLQPYLDSNIVDLTEWPYETPCQLLAYQHFINRANRHRAWIAFIDCDEFLFSPAHDNVNQILASQEPPVAFGANWMCFGSGGQEKYDDRPVIERFYLRQKDDMKINTHIKSIVRLDQFVQLWYDPHFFNVENGTYNEIGEAIYGPMTKYHTSKMLRINHYKTKSKEEFMKRYALGKPDMVRPVDMETNMKYFDEVQGTEVEDRTIQRFLPMLKKKLSQ
jgi:hypothetical protein